MSWNKLAAIGDWSTVFPLKAIGIDIYPVEDLENAAGTLRKLALSKKHGVIFVVEDYLEDVHETMQDFASNDLPAIILIPSVSGSQGLGLSIIRETMKKAAGRDILSDQQT